jgi:hypothetical protein
LTVRTPRKSPAAAATSFPVLQIQRNVGASPSPITVPAPRLKLASMQRRCRCRQRQSPQPSPVACHLACPACHQMSICDLLYFFDISCSAAIAGYKPIFTEFWPSSRQPGAHADPHTDVGSPPWRVRLASWWVRRKGHPTAEVSLLVQPRRLSARSRGGLSSVDLLAAGHTASGSSASPFA